MTVALSSSKTQRGIFLSLLGCLVLMAGWLRWRAGTVDGLWLDEVFGASYANLGFLETIVAVLRFDIHPPLYYLQLNLWAKGVNSDGGLLLNSVLWSVTSVLLVYYGVQRIYGQTAGLVAAVLVAVLGSEVFYASELRMYAMLGCNVLALWLVGEHWVESPSKAGFIGQIVLLATLSMLHSAAFVAVGCVLSYLLVRLWQCGQMRRWKSWSVLLFFACVFLLPWLVNASFRSVSHAVVPDLIAAGDTLAGWLLGYFPAVPELAKHLAVAVVVLGAVWVLGWGDQRARAVMLAFVVMPVMVIAVVSWLLRPIWLDRTLAFAAPFFAIGLVQAVTHAVAESRVRNVALASLAVVWCVLILGAGQLIERSVISRKMQFREAASFIVENNPQGLAVYVPVNFRYWGMARYLIGPEWGTLLKVQDPDRVDTSVTWAGIYRRMDDQWLDRLGLKPTSRKVSAKNFDVWIGLSPLPADAMRAGYFFVGDMQDAKKKSACPQGVEQSRKVFRGVLVVRCEPLREPSVQ